MRGSSRWNIEMIMGFILNHKGMITLLITIGFISLFFILMSVRLIFLKGGEFKGTCASQGNVCEVCGKKGECDK